MQGLGPSGRPAHRAQALHLAAIWQVVKVSCCRTATDFIARMVQCHGFVTASGCLRGPLREGPDPRPPRLGTRQLQGARRPENRSEERRVGKECRSRWAADNEEKQKEKVER